MKTTAPQTIRKIPVGRPCIGEEEFEATRKLFGSDWILDGPEVRNFEKTFCQFTGAQFAAGVITGTAAIHLALAGFGFEKGSEVLMPSFNFAAAGLSVFHAGLTPRFVEIDPETGNMDAQDLASKVNKKTRAILALHYAGRPADMNSILAIAEMNKLKIIEDAAHALGATYHGKMIGNIGHATCFSFGPVKMITTGSGGMVTTNDAALNRRIQSLRSYGMDRSMFARDGSAKPWVYAVDHLGHNFRMTDFAGAMGIVQMGKLPKFIEARQRIVDGFDRGLAEFPAISNFKDLPATSAVRLYHVVKVTGGLRDDLATFLNTRGIGANVHWDPPLHLHGLYRELGYKVGDLPLTERTASEIMTLPLAPQMTQEDVDYIVDAVREFFKRG